MKKSNYTGWWEVFRFSLIQGMKGKVYIGFLVLSTIILIASGLVTGMLEPADTDVEIYRSGVTEFTIYDDVGLTIDYSKALMDVAFRYIKINSNPTRTFEEHVKALEEESKDMNAMSQELIVHVVYEQEGYFKLTFVKAANSAVMAEDYKKLAEEFITFFDKARIDAIDASQEQIEFLKRPMESRLEFLAETGEVVLEKNEKITMQEYMLLSFGIVGVTIVIALSGGSIATSIVMEKSTRVVEYLTINIRPKALLIGKILAVLLMVLVQFGVMGISSGISILLKEMLFGTDVAGAVIATRETVGEVAVMMEHLSDINIVDIMIAGVVIICGVLFYCMLAGLAGASVSNLEEINEGLKIFNMLMIVGAGLGIIMCTSMIYGEHNQLLVNICGLLPISAPFVVPMCVLLNKIPMGIAVISMLILVVVIGFLYSFTAKVYEALIFYKGNDMKFKDILQITKNHERAERKR